MSSKFRSGGTTQPKPYIDVRVGGLRLIIQQVPYRLFFLVAGILGAAGGVTWLGQ
ncbi:hypothetical protein STXM2123_4488 [Streptomyces sp. F-3]|uniref:hypothetical protein n=1 Tax=Streptomyces sp. F-3 TaxID=1840095 RepID=UPI0007C367BE|nr:hypothetical protein [Streptomyces sp. F-3]GAT83787.1 hypothetical protein STXM2123_4488 [Streptomyces sp. F-3]